MKELPIKNIVTVWYANSKNDADSHSSDMGTIYRSKKMAANASLTNENKLPFA